MNIIKQNTRESEGELGHADGGRHQSQAQCHSTVLSPILKIPPKSPFQEIGIKYWSEEKKLPKKHENGKSFTETSSGKS